MVVSPETQALLLACKLQPSKRVWQQASVSLFADFWGAQPGFEKQGFLRRVNRASTAVAYEAFRNDQMTSRKFVRAGWYRQRGVPHPPLRNNGAMYAFVQLVGSSGGWNLQAPEASMLRLLLTFYGIEGVLRPQIALLWGVSAIAVGNPLTHQQILLEHRTRKLRSVEAIIDEFARSFGQLRADPRTKSSVKAFQALVSSVSTKRRAQYTHFGLADVRNMVAHGDFDIDERGTVRFGYNSLPRQRAVGPGRLSPARVESTLLQLNSLETMFASWGAFLRLMAAGRPRKVP